MQTAHNIRVFTLEKGIGVLAFLLMLFPWVSFGVLKTDTQPWYILLGLAFILLCYRKKVPSIIWLGYLMPAAALLVGFIHYASMDLITVRAVLSYLGLSVSIHAFYLFRTYYTNSVLPFLIAANIVWLFAGLLQVTLGANILEFMVTVRTTADRGVTSLAPEPTYFAVFLIFISWLVWIESGYKLNRLMKTLLLVNFLAIVVLAQSAMGLLFVAYFFLVYFLVFILRRKVLRMVFTILPIVIVAVLILTYFVQDRDMRVAKLYFAFIESPSEIIKLDASINSRVAHVVLPLHGSVLNAFLPHGYHSYQDQAVDLAARYDELFWYGYGGSKIMSAISAAIYELGWLSIIFLSILLRLLWNRFEYKISILNIVIMFSFLFAAISVAFPLIGMILAAIFIREVTLLKNRAISESLTVAVYAKSSYTQPPPVRA